MNRPALLVEEAERRFRTEKIPNCSVTSYRYDESAGRLVLGDSARVFWSDPVRSVEQR